jgi:hypothetical protein
MFPDPLELSIVAADSAGEFSGVTGSNYSDGDAFRVL